MTKRTARTHTRVSTPPLPFARVPTIAQATTLNETFLVTSHAKGTVRTVTHVGTVLAGLSKPTFAMVANTRKFMTTRVGVAVKVGTVRKKGERNRERVKRMVMAMVARLACLFLEMFVVSLMKAAAAEMLRFVLTAAVIVLVTRVFPTWGSPFLLLSTPVPEEILIRALRALKTLMKRNVKRMMKKLGSTIPEKLSRTKTGDRSIGAKEVTFVERPGRASNVFPVGLGTQSFASL